VIPDLRSRFNHEYDPARYPQLLARLEERCAVPIAFRIAETPAFFSHKLLEEIAHSGARLCQRLLAHPDWLAAARQAIPAGYRVAAETPHPNFLTADFALIRDEAGKLSPRLVEMQAFPSVYGFQAELTAAYREIFSLEAMLHTQLGTFLSGLDEDAYWQLLRQTIVGPHDPKTVVLTEVDPQRQKTLPDFNVTARRLGIAVVDIATLQPEGSRLTYRNASGRRIPISRIYNRAIADELIARHIQLPFDLEQPWDVEWAGHPNWYFLISKFSIPFLCRPDAHSGNPDPALADPALAEIIPPAVFLNDFLAGPGRAQLEAAGVPLPPPSPDAVYSSLLLKPLFSFAGKGIQFDPTHAQLTSIPLEQRSGYLLQQRMTFVPTVETPLGPTQAEIRILYLWPDGGQLTPVLPLVRLGRGRMMGVDHNRNLEWVGASGAFYPATESLSSIV
jgi:hypothetical protein